MPPKKRLKAIKAGKDFSFFDAKFKDLEDKMGAVSDDLAKWQEQMMAEHETVKQKATIAYIILACTSVFVTLAIPFFSVFGLFRPQSQIIDVMKKLADGDVKVDVVGLGRKDEIGAIATSVQIFKENAVAKLQLEKEQEAQKHKAEIEKKKAMQELADSFEASVEGVVASVSSAAEQMLSLSAL